MSQFIELIKISLPIFIELVKTLPNVVILYILTVLFSIPLGILGALAYTGKNKAVKVIISVYTWICRGTPLMLQLLWNTANEFWRL